MILQVFCVFGFSFLLVVLKTPVVVMISDWFSWYDKPDGCRKKHGNGISRLGGIAIFFGTMMSMIMFIDIDGIELRALIAATVVLFVIGLKDDLSVGVTPMEKLAIQLLAAFLMIFFGNCRLTSFYGVFSFYQLNEIFSLFFSVLLVVFVVNSFNLIDGINGLAATLGLVINLAFGVLFMTSGAVELSYISFVISGTLAGFLYFNLKGSIFMGDAGALIIGLWSVVQAIWFIELEPVAEINFFSRAAISVAILIVPVFDGLRVFFIRILQGKSPFHGDLNHIHHRLLKTGLNNLQVVFVLALFKVYLIILVLLLQYLGDFLIISVLLITCMVLNSMLTYLLGKQHRPGYRFKDVLIRDTLKLK